MIISKELNYVFVSVPKTGTHAMFEFLTEHFQGEHSGGHYHNHEVPEYAEDYFRFCTVRSPYNRFASAWSLIMNPDAMHGSQIKEMIGEEPTLISTLEWVVAERENMMQHGLDGIKVAASLVPLHLYFEQRLNNMRMDAFIQIEHATEQFNNLPFVKSYIEVPVVFSMKSKPFYRTWEEIKSPEATKLVNEWAGEDFDKFNYIKE
jgi:hypothetical protein